MNKIIKFATHIITIFLISAFASATDTRSHSVPDLVNCDSDIASVKRAASYPQLQHKKTYEQQMAIVVRDTILQREKIEEERKKNHKESESGLFSNLDEIDRDITCSLLFLFSALNVYQAFQYLTIPEFGLGVLGFCGSTYLSLRKIHAVDDENQNKYGKHPYGHKEPVPSFWYQTQYVYYGILGVLFCTSLMSCLDHSRLAYFM